MTEALPLRVLFICVENANRNQMAAAFAHVHGVARVGIDNVTSCEARRATEKKPAEERRTRALHGLTALAHPPRRPRR